MLAVDDGARRIGEFAFGMNEAVTEFTLNTLFDEKIGGTVHLALGKAYPETGGQNASALHWDLVCDLRQGAEVYADGELVYRDGRFLKRRRLARAVLALVGDTHLPRGSRRLPDACVALLREASLVLHLGDFTAASVLEELRALAPVEAVHGNMDEWPLRELLPERLVVEADGLRIGLVHDAGPRRGGTSGCGGSSRTVRSSRTATRTCRRRRWSTASGSSIPGSPTERRRAPAHTMAVVRDGVPELVTL